VGRALAALQITAIAALSPQAKGRVERLWGTLQDRLVAELRLAGARTLAQANAVLEHFIADYNRRFARAAAQPQAAWRPAGEGVDLARVCSFGYQARVLNDNTVRLSGVVIDIPPGPAARSYARARVEVRQLLDGSWRVYHEEQLIATTPATNNNDELRALKGRYHWAFPAALKPSPPPTHGLTPAHPLLQRPSRASARKPGGSASGAAWLEAWAAAGASALLSSHCRQSTVCQRLQIKRARRCRPRFARPTFAGPAGGRKMTSSQARRPRPQDPQALGSRQKSRLWTCRRGPDKIPPRRT
jgi:hypothetical protein